MHIRLTNKKSFADSIIFCCNFNLEIWYHQYIVYRLLHGSHNPLQTAAIIENDLIRYCYFFVSWWHISFFRCRIQSLWNPFDDSMLWYRAKESHAFKLNKWNRSIRFYFCCVVFDRFDEKFPSCKSRKFAMPCWCSAI